MIQKRPGRLPSPLGRATQELLPGTGFKVPCEWAHLGRRRQGGSCPGIKLARKMAKRMEFKIIGRCRDGVVWVYRPE